jgi:hypothetical protein
MNLLDFILDRSPAVLAYFCQVHNSNETNPGAMKKTLDNWYTKLWDNFQKDFMPLLQTIQSENFDVLSIILKIASGSCELNQFSPELFDQWEPLLLLLLRQTLDGKVVFVGYYAYLIICSCEFN